MQQEYHDKNNNNGDDDNNNVTDADAPIVLFLKRQHSAKRSRAVSLAFGWGCWLALASTCSTCLTLQRKIADQTHFRGLLRQGQQQYREGTNNNTDHKKNDSSADKSNRQPFARTV